MGSQFWSRFQLSNLKTIQNARNYRTIRIWKRKITDNYSLKPDCKFDGSLAAKT
jgi:hypothetical protein